MHRGVKFKAIPGGPIVNCCNVEAIQIDTYAPGHWAELCVTLRVVGVSGSFLYERQCPPRTAYTTTDGRDRVDHPEGQAQIKKDIEEMETLAAILAALFNA